jgi:hypothetical protein
VQVRLQQSRCRSLRKFEILLPGDRLAVCQECREVRMEEKFIHFDSAKLRVGLAPLRNQQNHLPQLLMFARICWGSMHVPHDGWPRRLFLSEIFRNSLKQFHLIKKLGAGATREPFRMVRENGVRRSGLHGRDRPRATLPFPN